MHAAFLVILALTLYLALAAAIVGFLPDQSMLFCRLFGSACIGLGRTFGL